MSDLYKIYAEADGTSLSSFQLRYQGRKLFHYNTPRSLQWFDQVEVECQPLQPGQESNVHMLDDDVNSDDLSDDVGDGFFYVDSTNEDIWEGKAEGERNDSFVAIITSSYTGSSEEALVTVKVRHQTGEVRSYTLYRSAQMQSIFSAQAQSLGVDGSDLRFLLDGERIRPESTPDLLDLMEGDVIDCLVGGQAC